MIAICGSPGAAQVFGPRCSARKPLTFADRMPNMMAVWEMRLA
jgi:hypothetical protein